MAITLTVDLTDTEQSRLEQAAALVAPGATPAQIKAWAEATMKRELRRVARQRYLQALRDADTADRDAELATWATDWTEV